jgi:hypothetical protein
MLFGFSALALSLFKTRGQLKGVSLIGFLLSVVFVALSAIVNLDTSLVASIKIGCLIMGFYMANRMNIKLFLRAYVHLMIIISVFSLLVFFLPEFFIGLDYAPEIEGYKGQVFKVFWLSNIRLSLMGYRNWGPFWEPGVYQTYLILAIIFLLFDDTGIKKRNLSLIILTVTLITTFSTTGFIAAPFIFFAYMLNKSQSKRSAVMKIAFFAVLFVAIIWFVNSEFFDVVFLNKFENIDDTGRNLTVEYGLKLWIKRPIFGYGSEYTQEMYELAGHSFGITNTFVGNLITHGAVVGIYSIIAIFMYAKSYKTKPLVFIFLAIGLILTMSGENYKFSPIICFLMFYRFNLKTICEKEK